jgi:hypothetical protein
MTETEWWVIGAAGVMLMIVGLGRQSACGRAILNLTTCIVAGVLLAWGSVVGVIDELRKPDSLLARLNYLTVMAFIWSVWFLWLLRAALAARRRKQPAPNPAGGDPAAPQGPR